MPAFQRRLKIYWARYWCFKSQKREKRVVPTARSDGASGSAQEWPSAPAGLGLAPPSSPASFVNSTSQSPANFTASLSAVSASMSSPGRPNPMFTIGPYAHETQLVTPPVFSTFTTEPSTAPFTPPPELAHLTTPSSPDVPFAQYVSSTLEAKRATGETISPFSTSTLASPCDTPVGYTPTSGRHYLGSPAGQLMSPTMGSFSGELISHGKYYLYSSAYAVKKGSSFPTYDPLASANMDGVPCASFLLSNESSTKREEASPPSIVQLDLIDEHGVRTLHQKPSNTAMYELSAGSLSEDNTNLMAHKHGILLHQQSGEKSSELQMDAGRSSKEDLSNGIVPLKAAKNSGINCNHVGDENDGSSAAVSSSECIKKGDILQEYVAHKCNERGVLQYETELCVEP